MPGVFSSSKKRGTRRDLRFADGDMLCAIINVLFTAQHQVATLLPIHRDREIHIPWGLWFMEMLGFVVEELTGLVFLSMEPQQVLYGVP